MEILNFYTGPLNNSLTDSTLGLLVLEELKDYLDMLGKFEKEDIPVLGCCD